MAYRLCKGKKKPIMFIPLLLFFIFYYYNPELRERKETPREVEGKIKSRDV
jgi:hypothetical protein